MISATEEISLLLGCAEPKHALNSSFNQFAKGALYKDVNSYKLPSTNTIIASNLDDLILWFKDDYNSEEVMKIEAKIQN